MQAVNASDVSLGRFYFLKRLLLLHGGFHSWMNSTEIRAWTYSPRIRTRCLILRCWSRSLVSPSPSNKRGCSLSPALSPGRNNYRRTSKLVLLILYKNIYMIITQLIWFVSPHPCFPIGSLGRLQYALSLERERLTRCRSIDRTIAIQVPRYGFLRPEVLLSVGGGGLQPHLHQHPGVVFGWVDCLFI